MKIAKQSQMGHINGLLSYRSLFVRIDAGSVKLGWARLGCVVLCCVDWVGLCVLCCVVLCCVVSV